MSIPKQHLLAAVLVVVVVLVGRASCSGHQSALFIFGDSYVDTGNNNYINTTKRFKGNVYPYGENFFQHKATGRFSDGLLMPDFIAKYAGLPLSRPYLTPGKFEFNGDENLASGISGALAETFAGFVLDVNSQLGLFEQMVGKLTEKFGKEVAEKILSDAVYLFCIGTNDLAYPFFVNSTLFQSHTKLQYVDMVIGNVTTVIKGIHAKGGRKFGIINVGPIGCLPAMRGLGINGSCFEDANDLVKLHNRAFKKVLGKLGNELKGFKYSNFDMYKVLMRKIDNPSKYGFKEGKVACCGSGPYRGQSSCGGREDIPYELCSDPSEHLFFDSGHLTQKAYEQISKLIWSGSTKVAKPYNLEALFKLDA